MVGDGLQSDRKENLSPHVDLELILPQHSNRIEILLQYIALEGSRSHYPLCLSFTDEAIQWTVRNRSRAEGSRW